jgi:hypothetical protein
MFKSVYGGVLFFLAISLLTCNQFCCLNLFFFFGGWFESRDVGGTR